MESTASSLVPFPCSFKFLGMAAWAVANDWAITTNNILAPSHALALRPSFTSSFIFFSILWTTHNFLINIYFNRSTRCKKRIIIKKKWEPVLVLRIESLRAIIDSRLSLSSQFHVLVLNKSGRWAKRMHEHLSWPNLPTLILSSLEGDSKGTSMSPLSELCELHWPEVFVATNVACRPVSSPQLILCLSPAWAERHAVDQTKRERAQANEGTYTHNCDTKEIGTWSTRPFLCDHTVSACRLFHSLSRTHTTQRLWRLDPGNECKAAVRAKRLIFHFPDLIKRWPQSGRHSLDPGN